MKKAAARAQKGLANHEIVTLAADLHLGRKRRGNETARLQFHDELFRKTPMG